MSALPDRDSLDVPPGRDASSLGGSGGRYLAVGGLSFAIDLGTLAGLRELFDVPVAAATFVAFVVSLGCNFLLNRGWVFGAAPQSRLHRAFGRYLLLVGVNLLIALTLVTGGTAVGVPYPVAKTVATALGVVLNYLAYRTWVFR